MREEEALLSRWHGDGRSLDNVFLWCMLNSYRFILVTFCKVARSVLILYKTGPVYFMEM
jgi:hypothetical protein